MTSQLKRPHPEGVSDSGQEKKRRTSTTDHTIPSVQTQPASGGNNGDRQQKPCSTTGTKEAVYNAFEKRVLAEHDLRYFNYPRPVRPVPRVTLNSTGINTTLRKVIVYGVTESSIQLLLPGNVVASTLNPLDDTVVVNTHMTVVAEDSGLKVVVRRSHVHRENWYLDVKDFKRTDVAEDNHEVYAMDTESIHTVKGLEVAKVSVVNTSCDVVYEEKCLPTTEIIDYNTIWSGLKESDFSGVTKTFSEVQQDLLNMISPNTILVGHGLGTDLMALKIVHNKAVDTVQLFPHPRGLPRKKSLKDLAEEQLRTSIQVGDGHDSRMDSEVAMKLALKKLGI